MTHELDPLDRAMLKVAERQGWSPVMQQRLRQEITAGRLEEKRSQLRVSMADALLMATVGLVPRARPW